MAQPSPSLRHYELDISNKSAALLAATMDRQHSLGAAMARLGPEALEDATSSPTTGCRAAQCADHQLPLGHRLSPPDLRRGKKTATTAVARKLLVRAYHLLAAADPCRRRPNPGDRKSATPPTSKPSTISTWRPPGASKDRDGHQPRARSQNRMSRPHGPAR